MNEGRPGGRSVALKNEEKRTKPIMAQIAQALTSLPRHACRSITFDRGSEFVDWPHLQAEVGTQTWFCEAQSPWQKGRTREHYKRLRRRLTRDTDPNSLPQEEPFRGCRPSTLRTSRQAGLLPDSSQSFHWQ